MSSDVIALSRITYKKMMQNLVWATTYNAIAIPAAAGAFVHSGNYSCDEHRCPRDEPVDCDRGGERAVSTSFRTLTLLTMDSYAAWCALRPVGKMK